MMSKFSKLFVGLVALVACLFPHQPCWGLTDDQVQLVRQLSPEDRQALLRMIAEQNNSEIRSFADEGEKSPESETPQEAVETVRPRVPETSSLEEDFRLEKETGDPAQESSSRQQAETGQGEKIQPAFEGLQDTATMTVDTTLEQFGYDLFAGAPTTFAPATTIPVPAEYVLGPGDEIKVQLFGKMDRELMMVVDREGAIAFPEIGPLTVAGMRFFEARAYIAEQIKEKTIGVSASITMGNLRSIRVFALGEVAQPGSYIVSGLATLSQALFASGGVKKIGSLRNVQLKRNGELIAVIDLYDFLMHGDTSADVRLLPGDVVFVPPIGNTVGIAGEVKRPAIYEVKNEGSVADLIRLAGGLQPTAYRQFALVERISSLGERVVKKLELEGPGLEMPIKDHDLVKVFSVLDFEENPVFLFGNVKRPGKYAWYPDMRLSDLVPSPEVLRPETYLEYGLIERESAALKEPEILRFKPAVILDEAARGTEEDTFLQPRDKVFLFHRSNFREPLYVEIAGSVMAPGKYDLKKSMRIIDLVLAGGGLLRDADRARAELYRKDPKTGTLHLVHLEIDKALSGDPEHNLLLMDRDRLVIHSRWETKERFQVRVGGEIRDPGMYDLAAGMRVSDLVFAAGNITERAFLKQAEITRYYIVGDEQRVSDHFQIDLARALAGDPEDNITLQPHDHLIVRRLSNWRATESVTISGEVKYPGTYPIESGETLYSLLVRAGGYLPGAYLPGAVFTRESLRLDQQNQHEKMIKRIEEEILLLESSIGTIRDTELVARKQQSLESAKQTLEQMREIEATGRLVIDLAELEQLAGTDFDLSLRGGDRLHIPEKTNEVQVIGQVYNQTAFVHDQELHMDDYLEMAGGTTRFADEDRVYVVRASGSVDLMKGWKRKRIQPGDVIVVPERLDRFNLLDSTLDWSRVLMQLGIGVASMKTLNIL